MAFRDVRDNLASLPRCRDRHAFLYVDKRKIHQNRFGIALSTKQTEILLPVSQFNVLLIGTGVSITSAAVLALADHGVSLAWVGDGGVRFYGHGHPLTFRSRNLEVQAKVVSFKAERSKAIRRLYVKRFGTEFPASDSVNVLRGHEGRRVKAAYVAQAQKYGIRWQGRKWLRDNWNISDRVNKALSVVSSCLYGLVHAVIVSVGFSPGLGLVHTGDMRSFVLDIADLYRESITIPLAFSVAATGALNVEKKARRACRDYFLKEKLVERIVPDLYEVLGMTRIGARFIDFSGWEALRS